jgi:hypothetical protein
LYESEGDLKEADDAQKDCLAMMSKVCLWLCIGSLVAWAVLPPALAAEECPDLWTAQSPLVTVSKIARAFRDGIDRAYIAYTRADFQTRIDHLAASRVFAMQSFLTNHLEAVQTNAWQAFDILRPGSPIASRRAAVQFAEYLTTRVAAALDMIERYEYHNGNLYDGVSNVARSSMLVQPDTDLGAQYGSNFATLLQSLRQELQHATQALRQLKQCGD